MKKMGQKLFVTTGSILFATLAAHTGMVCNRLLAQEPRPVSVATPALPKLSLVPLVIVSVGVDNVAQPVSAPTGASRAPAEFVLPKTGSKEIAVTTSGGSIDVHFSDSAPAGVPANAFQWEQTSLPAGNATGRLRYSGCQGCPDSFTLHITASSNATVETSVKITLTASTARPVINGVTANGNDSVSPRFEVQFQRSTFDPSDSQVVATYASGLKYRLIPESNSQFSDGRMNVIVPRLEVNRGVKISLTNPYGTSSSSSITLPQQSSENPGFEQVNASGEFPESAQVNDTFSVKHSAGPLSASGSDDITILPLANASVCDQQDFIYMGAKATWLDNNDHPSSTLGSVSIASQPPANAPLRSANNKVHVNWSLNGFSGDKFYQVAFSGVTVVGVCNDRVIH